jgi:hypothetical protein
VGTRAQFLEGGRLARAVWYGPAVRVQMGAVGRDVFMRSEADASGRRDQTRFGLGRRRE